MKFKLIESDLSDFKQEFKIRKPSIYKGYIIDIDGNIDKTLRYFSIFGTMSDGTKCYHEVDSKGNHNEYDSKWYSIIRKKVNGKALNFFILEAED